MLYLHHFFQKQQPPKKQNTFPPRSPHPTLHFHVPCQTILKPWPTQLWNLRQARSSRGKLWVPFTCFCHSSALWICTGRGGCEGGGVCFLLELLLSLHTTTRPRVRHTVRIWQTRRHSRHGASQIDEEGWSREAFLVSVSERCFEDCRRGMDHILQTRTD